MFPYTTSLSFLKPLSIHTTGTGPPNRRAGLCLLPRFPGGLRGNRTAAVCGSRLAGAPRPLSEHTELIDFCDEAYGGILMAYRSKDRKQLLIWDGGWEITALISLSSLGPAELETIQAASGLSFQARRPAV